MSGATAADGRAAREELWRRYDAGALSTAELDARLALVDRAGDDPAALAVALDGPAPRRAQRSIRPMLVAGGAVVAIALVAAGAWWLTDGDGDGGADAGERAGGSDVRDVTEPPPPLPGPVAEPVDCPELDDILDGLPADAAAAEPPANPVLLSSPAFVPDGYAVADEESIAPGTDPDIAMSVNAGSPPPVEILGRQLNGALAVTMRAYRYESADAADVAGLGVLRQGVCTYGMESAAVPDRPELTSNVVSGPIPTTAFAGFRLGERRFSVAVVAASDDDADIETARQLAITIAGAELDAARTAPPAG